MSTSHTTSVSPVTLGKPAEAEPEEWFAWCGEHNWYGEYRTTKSEAQTDAARHRRWSRS